MCVGEECEEVAKDIDEIAEKVLADKKEREEKEQRELDAEDEDDEDDDLEVGGRRGR